MMETKRRRRCLISSDSCRINDLPDEILSPILSNLTMKEAARTSVLSRRWQNLWVYSTGSLNFELAGGRSGNQKPKLIRWVNNILALHRAPTVDGFRVCYDLDETNADDIDRWIKFAMQKSVSSFELDFSIMNGLVFKWYDCYQFPSKLILDSPSRSFGSLTSLRLISVDTSDQVVAYFICNCQSLQHLAIKGAASLTRLDATTALKLKHLEIEVCHGLENVDISNTNIKSLKFNGGWHSTLEKLHLLTDVSLNAQWCTRVVQNRFWPLPLSQLQRLQLDMGVSCHSGEIDFPEVFPTLHRLKYLEVSLGAFHNQNIFCLTSLICASPLLISFTLRVDYLEPEDTIRLYELPDCEWRKSEKRVHQCLKVVEFIGWYGYKSDMDLVYYLMINSLVLQKVIIDPKIPFIQKRSALEQESFQGSG